jgi:hypothetical protein
VRAVTLLRSEGERQLGAGHASLEVGAFDFALSLPVAEEEPVLGPDFDPHGDLIAGIALDLNVADSRLDGDLGQPLRGAREVERFQGLAGSDRRSEPHCQSECDAAHRRVPPTP